MYIHSYQYDDYILSTICVIVCVISYHISLYHVNMSMYIYLHKYLDYNYVIGRYTLSYCSFIYNNLNFTHAFREHACACTFNTCKT